MNILSFSRLNEEPPFQVNAAELVQPRSLDYVNSLLADNNPENLTERSREIILQYRDKVLRYFPNGVC
jgi:hypothetical protein